jgi:PadR family transcriptional regulator
MSNDRRAGVQLLKGTLPLLILSTLRDTELHGYEIAKRIRERSGGVLTPSEGALYPTLHRLEADGQLVATWREGEAGPRRRYYRLTKAGLTALEAAEGAWTAFTGGVNRVALGGSGDA